MVTEELVHQALSLWHQNDQQGTPFTQLLLWQNAINGPAGGIRRATNQVLNDGLALLGIEDAQARRVIELRFLREEAGSQIANMLHIAEGTVWRKQRAALTRLTAILQTEETKARAARIARFTARLEAPSARELFGVDAHLAQLREEVNRQGAPWLIAIEGIGGIGKTALTNALVHHLLGDAYWQEVAWVTARQQIFNGGGAIKPIPRPALTADALVDGLVEQLLRAEIGTSVLSMEQKRAMLQARLRARPHLIVIDNLETLLDVETLLATLRAWANPTKFLLTTRFSRFYETDIFHFSVPELSQADALALVRTEANVRNNAALTAASDAELLPIYTTVGGNPLALRLVVGQTHVHGLSHVLADLHGARGHSVEQLYHYIYWQAWHALDEVAQQTLLMMPLVTEAGGDLAFLTAMATGANLSATAVSDALTRLAGLSLVDSRGGLHERRYTIHALTRTFLQEQVLKWGEE